MKPMRPSDWKAALFAAAAAAVALGAAGRPLYIPDSYEQALIFDCAIRGGSTGLNCAGAHLLFRPPAMAFAAGALSATMPIIIAVGLCAWLAGVALFATVWRMGARAGGWMMAAGAVSALAASPFAREVLMLADARVFCLPFLFGSFLLAMPPENGEESKWRALGAGGLVGIAALSRPECQLAALLLVGFQALRNWRLSLWTLLGASLFIAPWITVLSLSADRTVLGPRWWEGFLLLSWQEVPRRWALQLFGMGLFSPEGRAAALLAGSPGSGLVQQQGMMVGIRWLSDTIGSSIPLWVWLSGLAGCCWGLRNPRTRWPSLALLTLSLPYIAAGFMPQARAPIFPHANLIPACIAAIAAAGATAGRLAEHFVAPKGGRAAAWCALAAAALLSSVTTRALELPYGIETDPAGQAAVRWLRSSTPERAKIFSSYENAAMSFLAGRHWQQTPSPWERRRWEQADYAIVSSLDSFWTGSDEMGTLEAYFGGEEQWVAIYSMEKAR
jgi:hypothetical protein